MEVKVVNNKITIAVGAFTLVMIGFLAMYNIEQNDPLYLIPTLTYICGFGLSTYFILRTEAEQAAKLFVALLMLVMSIFILWWIITSAQRTFMVSTLAVISSFAFLVNLILATVSSLGNPKLEIR